MRKLQTISLVTMLLFAGPAALAQAKKVSPKATKPGSTIRKTGPTAAPATPRAAPRASGSQYNSTQRQLSDALAMIRSGQYQQAAPVLFSLSRRPDLAAERMQIKYLLGLSLSEMGLYQTAAFQFVDVIRNGGSRYVRQAIERLSIAADALGDDTLLNYAISKVRLEEFPQNQKDVVYFRLGEIKLRNGQSAEASELFARVNPGGRFGNNAKYNRGLALLEANKPGEALPLFQNLLRSRGGTPITDTTKVAAQMAVARTFYQMQDWDHALEAYREIPRDSEFWHDALFESSWANLRAARFRSTLSNLQSLHSAFYEDRYIPESLLVRSIVYLYICKFDETDKTLNLFDKQYGPVRSQLAAFLRNNRDPMLYFSEAEKAYMIRKDRRVPNGMRLPYMSIRAVLDEGNVKRSFNYLRALNDEKARIDGMANIARSSLGVYAMKVISSRFKNAKVAAGELVRGHLTAQKKDLDDYFEQSSFIRYEMINGKKELLKKKIAGKDAPKTVNDDVDRVFYVQNGYQYWPFDGEYWLDEIGNYHYLGQQSCE